MLKGKMDVRFEGLKNFYSMYKSGLNDEQTSKFNVGFVGYKLTEAELPKFAERHPDIDLEDFKNFLTMTEALVVAGEKQAKSSTVQLRINTADKAREVGVKEEDIPQFIELATKLVEVKNELQKLVPEGSVSLAIPKRSKKGEATATETAQG